MTENEKKQLMSERTAAGLLPVQDPSSLTGSEAKRRPSHHESNGGTEEDKTDGRGLESTRHEKGHVALRLNQGECCSEGT